MRIQLSIIICLLMLLCSMAFPVSNDLYDVSAIRTIKLEFAQSNWWSQLTANADADQNIPGTLLFDDEVFDSVGVRFRGMTSYMMTRNSQKKSFNIELDWKKDQKLMGYEELNLINCNSDPTFMREILYSNTCREVLPSAKVNYVKLEINGENWGIYANVQQLDGKFIREWFPSNDGTRWRGGIGGNPGGGGGGWNPGTGGGGGGFNGDAALTYKGSDSTSYIQVYEIKNTNQADPWASLVHTCDVLNNTPLEQLPAELSKVLDIDRALWLCAFEIVFQDHDGYVFKRGSDYYLYYEPESGRIHLIQYDANECMTLGGGMPMPGGGGAGGGEQVPPFYMADDSNVPVMYRLMQLSEYRQRYLAHVRSILSNYLNEDYLFPKIDAYRELIEPEVKLDDKKLYSYSEFNSGITELKSFIQDRKTYLMQNEEVTRQAPEILSVNKILSNIDSEQHLSILAQINNKVGVTQVNLYLAESNYGPFESYPMFDDGLHNDGTANDNIYGIELPFYTQGTVLRYYIQAIADDNFGTMTFKPYAEHLAYKHVFTFEQAEKTPVVINELMAQNNSFIADPQGEFDDWIELKNVTDEIVDLSGMYLSDNLENPLKWQFPPNTVIEPDSYLIIWADEDVKAESGLHANFKLSADGETILLFDTDENGNALLDSISFHSQIEDKSFGRNPSEISKWLVLANPTPGAQNDSLTPMTNNSTFPQIYRVWQAYPNPFNIATNIRYQIPENRTVTIKVYNMMGQEIKTLIEKWQEAGIHTVIWNGIDNNGNQVSSGVYYYRITAGSFIRTNKMVLMK